MTGVRRVLSIAGLSVVAFLSARDAGVRSSLAFGQLNQAGMVWSQHPAVVIAQQMARIGESAEQKQPIGDSLTAPIIDVARRAPLAIEPFLVQGVKLQAAGDDAGAERLFKAAQERNPRAPAPHFFLSLHYGKTGHGALSLNEMGKMIRLLPGSAGQIAPLVAPAVAQAGGQNMIRSLVAESPSLRDNVMMALATDARNFEFISSLVTPDTATDWQPVMLRSLINAGQYVRAYSLWARANHVAPNQRPLLVDATGRLNLPPPFGWTLATSSAGIAESAEGGGLHLVSFGRETFTPASQTLLLAPGNFALSFTWAALDGNATAFNWQVTCLPSGTKIATIPFGKPGASGVRGIFSVPSGCPAQRLDLVSAVADVPQTVDLTITEIELGRLP